MTNENQNQLLQNFWGKHQPNKVVEVLQDIFTTHSTSLEIDAVGEMLGSETSTAQQRNCQKEIMADVLDLFTQLSNLQTVNA